VRPHRHSPCIRPRGGRPAQELQHEPDPQKHDGGHFDELDEEDELDDEEREVPEPVAPPSAEPLANLEAARVAERLSQALAALPLAQREAFLMHQEGDLTAAEIAAATGTNEEAAKSRLRYAMNKLKEAIGE